MSKRFLYGVAFWITFFSAPSFAELLELQAVTPHPDGSVYAVYSTDYEYADAYIVHYQSQSDSMAPTEMVALKEADGSNEFFNIKDMVPAQNGVWVLVNQPLVSPAQNPVRYLKVLIKEGQVSEASPSRTVLYRVENGKVVLRKLLRRSQNESEGGHLLKATEDGGVLVVSGYGTGYSVSKFSALGQALPMSDEHSLLRLAPACIRSDGYTNLGTPTNILQGGDQTISVGFQKYLGPKTTIFWAGMAVRDRSKLLEQWGLPLVRFTHGEWQEPPMLLGAEGKSVYVLSGSGVGEDEMGRGITIRKFRLDDPQSVDDDFKRMHFAWYRETGGVSPLWKRPMQNLPNGEIHLTGITDNSVQFITFDFNGRVTGDTLIENAWKVNCEMLLRRIQNGK